MPDGEESAYVMEWSEVGVNARQGSGAACAQACRAHPRSPSADRKAAWH